MSVTSSEMEGLSWKNAGLFGPLANELLIFMLSYLNVQDLTRVAQLCKWLKTIADDDILWKKHVAEVFPEETKPEHQSAKEFFRILTVDTLKREFKKKHPKMSFVAPVITHESSSLFSSDQSKLMGALCTGDENEIKKRLSNYKDDLVNLTLPDQLKESNEKLLTFINLSLNNKNNKHAFKMLMDALTPEARRAILLNNLRHYYLVYNYILQGITPFDDEAKHPLILHLLNDADSCDNYEVLIELVLAYHPKSFSALDENGNTIFHLVCVNGAIDLIEHVVDAIMATLPKLFITGDKNNELGIFALIRELEKNITKKQQYQYLNLLAKIIAKYPSLLNKHPFFYVRYNLSLARLIVKFMGEPRSLKIIERDEQQNAKNDYSEFKALFQEIDKHLIAEEQTTLLHVSLEYNHGISGYWAEKFASSVVDGMRYVDITDKQGRTSLVVALSLSEIHVPVIRELLNAGANPNVMVKGESALCFAFRNNLKKTMELLLKAGADPDFEYPEGSGNAPLWKYAQKNPKLLRLVKESYAKLNKPLPLNGKEKSALIAKLVEENRKLMHQIAELQSKQKSDSNSDESVAPSEKQMNVYNP